jgi:hypothetical protein
MFVESGVRKDSSSGGLNWRVVVEARVLGATTLWRGYLEGCDVTREIGDQRGAARQDDGGVEVRGPDQMFVGFYIATMRLSIGWVAPLFVLREAPRTAIVR